MICLACGVDQRTGKSVQSQVKTLSKRERREAAWSSGLAGLKLVLWGLRFNLAGVALTVGTIIATIVVASSASPMAPMFWLAEWGGLLSQACLIIGPTLCLFAPAESKARGLLISAEVTYGVGLVVEMLLGAGVATSLSSAMVLGVISMAASAVGTLLFLLFYLQLAKYIDDDAVYAKAESVVKAFISVILLALACYVPVVGCLAIFGLLGALVYTGINYVVLLHALSRSVARTIRDDFS